MFNKKFKKLDIFIVFVVVVISLLIFLIFSNQNSNVVEVFVSGELYGRYPLYENNKIAINTNNGSLILCIDKGKAFVIDADCTDGDCIKQGYISGNGKSIICLPLETVIRIGEEDYEIAY